MTFAAAERAMLAFELVLYALIALAAIGIGIAIVAKVVEAIRRDVT